MGVVQLMAGKRSIAGLGNCNRFALTIIVSLMRLAYTITLKRCLADDHIYFIGALGFENCTVSADH